MSSDITAAWRKATYSNAQASCVEVAGSQRTVLVRDTKQRHIVSNSRTVIQFGAGAWKTFTANLK